MSKLKKIFSVFVLGLSVFVISGCALFSTPIGTVEDFHASVDEGNYDAFTRTLKLDKNIFALSPDYFKSLHQRFKSHYPDKYKFSYREEIDRGIIFNSTAIVIATADNYIGEFKLEQIDKRWYIMDFGEIFGKK